MVAAAAAAPVEAEAAAIGQEDEEEEEQGKGERQPGRHSTSLELLEEAPETNLIHECCHPVSELDKRTHDNDVQTEQTTAL